jgi:hypothetical protein
MVLERRTDLKRSRRTCSPQYGLPSRRGNSAGVAKRPRELIAHPKSLPSRFATCVIAAGVEAHRTERRRREVRQFGSGLVPCVTLRTSVVVSAGSCRRHHGVCGRESVRGGAAQREAQRAAQRALRQHLPTTNRQQNQFQLCTAVALDSPQLIPLRAQESLLPSRSPPHPSFQVAPHLIPPSKSLPTSSLLPGPSPPRHVASSPLQSPLPA